jgi:hypothetical protein
VSRHSGLLNVLLLVAALLVTVVVLEGGSRLFYLVRWGGRLYPIHEVHYSLRLGWELAPGDYVNYRINRQGFRRPTDVALKRPAGVVRIFVVGGSTAFGFNGLYPTIPSKKLDYEDTIDYHLQTLLQRRHPDRRFEVINAAVTEYRLFQEITLFREKLVNYEPNLLIFVDGHNDASTLMGGAALWQEPAPYWNVRHFARGQRVLNSSPILGPLYYADLYLGRVSYFYHGLTVLFQRLHDVAPEAAGAAGLNAETGGRFRLEDEQRLLEQAGPRLQDLESALPMYVDQVRDLRALGAGRGVKLVYALQPELVAEDRAKLTPIEVQIQDLTFSVLKAYGGALGWRYMTRRIPAVLAELDAPTFRVVNLVTITDGTGEQLYTDYTHLTSRGNRKVAEKLYPVVAALLDLGEPRRPEGESARHLPSRGGRG